MRDRQADNPDCDYTYMNGTSAATPTIAGIAALMLSANPELTWRDARDIFRLSARKVDPDYLHNIPYGGDKPYGSLYDLNTDQLTERIGSADDIHDGAVFTPMDLGWQVNGAGHEYSNWYGFGVPDAERVVALAQDYARNPTLSRSGDVVMSEFTSVASWSNGDLAPIPGSKGIPVREGPFPYKRVSSAGVLPSAAQTVDQFQVRLTGRNVCLGSLGIAVKSPSGTVSLLKLPDDHFKADGLSGFEDYALASFAFYGEEAQGDWEIFTLASNPALQMKLVREDDNGEQVLDDSIPCPAADNDSPQDFRFLVQARIIAQ